jgi:PST family polysaccharide transporter
LHLFKVLSLTTLATCCKVVSQFAINKFIAVYLGPNGLAIIGQLQSFINLSSGFASGFISEGVVKYTAEKKETLEELTRYHAIAIRVTAICSIVISIILFCTAPSLSTMLFETREYSLVLRVLSITLFSLPFNLLFISILNGYKQVKKIVAIQIISSFISLTLLSYASLRFQLKGVLYAIILQHVLFFMGTLLIIYREKKFTFPSFKILFVDSSGKSQGILKDFSHFAVMSLVGITATTISHLFIREHIGSTLSWDAAGQWQGISTLSSTYLMLITSSLSIYYLPRLSELKGKVLLKREVFRGYKIIVPITLLSSFFIFLFREPIVHIAFSSQFEPMIPLFKWQLIGNCFKITSWLLSYLMIVKVMTKTFIWTELLSHSLFAALSLIFLNFFGLIGITYAFAANYFVYLILMFFVFRKKL